MAAEGRARLLRNGLGSLAILGVIVAISVGLPAVDHALPASRPVTAGARYEIGARVSVVPPPGSMVDLTETRPGSNRGTALFLIGVIRYLVVVSPYQGDLDAAADRLRDKITSTRGYQVTGRESVVTTGSGLTGRQGGYTAPGRIGRYAIFVVDGLDIEVTVSGTDPALRAALDGIETSTRSLAYRSLQ
jgi:hypothetical protein